MSKRTLTMYPAAFLPRKNSVYWLLVYPMERMSFAVIIINVVSSLISLFIIIGSGYYLRKRNIIDEKVTNGLSRILSSVGMPALILSSLQKESYSPESLAVIGTVGLVIVTILFTGGLAVWLICRIKKVPWNDATAWIACGGFSNAVFMVRPIASSLYGEAADFGITGAMITYNLLFFSIGVLFLNRNPQSKSGVGGQILSALLNPIMLISYVGIALYMFSIRLPEPVNKALSMLTDTTSPLSMLIIGSTLGSAPLKELFGDINAYLITGVRLLIAPVLTWLILRNIIQDPMYMTLMVLIAAMPTATTVGVFAERFNNNALLCSKVIFLSTMFSIVTIPLMVMLLL